MAFMRPEYTREDFTRYEDTDFGSYVVPSADFDESECDLPDSIELISGKVWYRFSAAGCMDQTDWCGPFASEAEARKDLENTYDSCSHCGDLLDDDHSTGCEVCKPESGD